MTEFSARFTLTERLRGIIRVTRFPGWAGHAVASALFVAVVAMTTKPEPSAWHWQEPVDTVTAKPLQQVSAINRAGQYAWLSASARKSYEPLANRVSPPAGYSRVEVTAGSLADWLRHLPAAPAGTAVKTGRGAVVLSADDPGLAAVIRLQPHDDRLLSAANMLIRLRAEHAWSVRQVGNLSFHYTSGQCSPWRAWAAGVRPAIDGRRVRFRETAEPDDSRAAFCGYLEMLFRYASTYSLLDDTLQATDHAVEAGDVFVRPGRPGHAMMILDVATAPGGDVKVLLGEGGWPAQTFHVPRGPDGNPWFTLTGSGGVDLGTRGRYRLDELRQWMR
ncbi:MAG: DUF4846 domain-containing protein [Planctomycetota bacterium]